MKDFLKNHRFGIIFILIVLIVSVSVFIKKQNETPNWTIGKVDEGTVGQIISVSGTVDATKTAELAFPISGIVESVFVKEGQTVQQGDKLITLKHNDLLADYQSAISNLNIAKANQSEILNGVRVEEKDIANTKVAIAQAELERVTLEQETKVTSAYRALLSSDLNAVTLNPEDNSTPPEITGTYTCNKEGFYHLDVFRSGSPTNYSYRLSGIESGTYTAYTDGPAPLGQCGLFIKFTAGNRYNDSKWEIKIPNTRSSSYTSNLNAYNLAITNRQNTLSSTKQDLELAIQNQNLTIAKPRTEIIQREEAKIVQSQAEIARIDSQINDHILVAPFAGVISDIKPNLGETVSSNPVITMISDDFFEVTALIPEIDITKIFIGQKAELIFDANDEKTLEAKITFVSPLAETIAGVSYFKTTMTLDNPADWLRGGLNADINIIVDEKKNVLRIPKRFLIERNNQYSVLIPDGKTAKEITVSVDFIGNDGFVAISGLNKDDVIIAP